ERFLALTHDESFPLAIASAEIQAAQFAEPAHAVDVSVANHWCAHRGVKSFFKLGFALAAAIPDDSRLRVGEIQQQGSLIIGRQEKFCARETRHRDRDFGPLRFAADWIRVRPNHLASFGHEAHNAVWMPDDELTFSTHGMNDRWRVTNLPGVECAPEF